MRRVKLVVVESPNKTKKIREFLGPEYRVAASFGHVRDLPMSGDLAVAFIDGKVIPRYQPLERSARAVDDLKRLAASFVVAARWRGFKADDARRIAVRMVRAYRESMLERMNSGVLESWYSRITIEDVKAIVGADDVARPGQGARSHSARTDP